MLRAVSLITLAGLALAPTTAAADCEDAAALRAELVREAARADRWNLAWQIAYAAGTVAQAAPAAAGLGDRDTRQTLWIGAAQTAVGALGAWLTPLEIAVPVARGTACADRDALRAAAEAAATEERQTFWLLHLGGLVVNGAAAGVTAERVSWQAGVLSFATGYPVSLLQIYTMPRAMWHRRREAPVTAQVRADLHQVAVIVGGSF